MKKLYLVLILLSSGLFAQDNPMFDSVDYFVRNKIKTIHYELSNWAYSPGWKYLKYSFDKNTGTLKNDTVIFDEQVPANWKNLTSMGAHSLYLKDTVYYRHSYSSTIKYQYDDKGRLLKMLNITDRYQPSEIIFPGSNCTTTTTYFYADNYSKKLTQVITESPSIYENRAFFYKKNKLVIRVDTKTDLKGKETSVETFSYEYYADGKLKKETRKVKDSRCKSNCEGTIDYSYDTE